MFRVRSLANLICLEHVCIWKECKFMQIAREWTHLWMHMTEQNRTKPGGVKSLWQISRNGCILLSTLTEFQIDCNSISRFYFTSRKALHSDLMHNTHRNVRTWLRTKSNNSKCIMHRVQWERHRGKEGTKKMFSLIKRHTWKHCISSNWL